MKVRPGECADAFPPKKLSMFLLQLTINTGISATHCCKTAGHRYKTGKVLWQVLTPRVSSAYQLMFMQVSLHRSHVLWGCGGSSEDERLLRDIGSWRDYTTAPLGSCQQVHWTFWNMEKVWKVWTGEVGVPEKRGGCGSQSMGRESSWHGKGNSNKQSARAWLCISLSSWGQ